MQTCLVACLIHIHFLVCISKSSCRLDLIVLDLSHFPLSAVLWLSYWAGLHKLVSASCWLSGACSDWTSRVLRELLSDSKRQLQRCGASADGTFLTQIGAEHRGLSALSIIIDTG